MSNTSLFLNFFQSLMSFFGFCFHVLDGIFDSSCLFFQISCLCFGFCFSSKGFLCCCFSCLSFFFYFSQGSLLSDFGFSKRKRIFLFQLCKFSRCFGSV